MKYVIFGGKDKVAPNNKVSRPPHAYTHSGIRVSQKLRENYKFEKKPLSLKNSSPGSKADFSEKFLFGNWRLILSRYTIK